MNELLQVLSAKSENVELQDIEFQISNIFVTYLVKNIVFVETTPSPPPKKGLFTAQSATFHKHYNCKINFFQGIWEVHAWPPFGTDPLLSGGQNS